MPRHSLQSWRGRNVKSAAIGHPRFRAVFVRNISKVAAQFLRSAG
jgi:hypothetical protein